jgi:hypothetical protein
MNDPIYSGGTNNVAYSSFYANSNSESEALFSVTSDYLIEDLSGGDYRLKSNSPLIDAGDPSSTYYDPDGSRNDIGLYGGPKSWGTAPTVTDLSVSPTSVDMGGSVTITATAKTN